MTEAPPEASAARPVGTPEDLTGRERIVRNVLTSWGGYFFFIVGGFVVPRLIDAHEGQVALGVWDFGWTLVSYFSLAQIGIGSSVNRYVARFRSLGDVAGLRRVITSTVALQLVVTVLVALVTAAVVWLLPGWFGQRLGDQIGAARGVVALLGAGLAVQMAFDTFRGVITGCHRWDLHNGIAAVSYAVLAVIMVLVLRAGYGVVGLGWANLGVTLATECIRTRLAYRVCPEMRIERSYWDLDQAKEALRYGVKTTTGHLAYLLLIQGNSLLVAKHAGVAFLALYARPMALIRHAESLADKLAFVLTPTASSLQGRGDHAELRSLLIDSVRASAHFIFPMMLGFAFLGDAMLSAWMGPRYGEGVLLSVFAWGFAFSLSQKPVNTILAGLNRHGGLVRQSLVASICGLALSALLVGRFGLSLLGAAIAVSATRFFFNGILAPLYACNVLGIRPLEYFAAAFRRPLVLAAPFALGLAGLRLFWHGGPISTLALGAVIGAFTLVPLYWAFVIPKSLKESLLRKLR